MVFKKQKLILAAIAVAMLALFFFFGWKPQVARLDGLAKEKAVQEQKIQAAKNTLMMLEEVKRNAANAEIELIKLSNKIPSDPELPSLIVETQNIANDAGINLISISPSEPASTGEYNELRMNVAASGSYVAIIDFLRRIEKAPRAFKVDTINLKLREYPDLDLTASITAFTVGEGTSTPPPPPPAQSASAAK